MTSLIAYRFQKSSRSYGYGDLVIEHAKPIGESNLEELRKHCGKACGAESIVIMNIMPLNTQPSTLN